METCSSRPVEEPLLSSSGVRPFLMELLSDVETSGEPVYVLSTKGGSLTAVFDRGEPKDPQYNTVAGKTVELADMRVSAEFTRRGIATGLLRTMAQEMAARGATELDMQVVNPVVMQMLARIFSMGKLTIYDSEKSTLALPLDDIQAAASIERANTRAEQRDELGLPLPSEFSYGLRVKVDLTDEEVLDRLHDR